MCGKKIWRLNDEKISPDIITETGTKITFMFPIKGISTPNWAQLYLLPGEQLSRRDVMWEHCWVVFHERAARARHSILENQYRNKKKHSRDVTVYDLCEYSTQKCKQQPVHKNITLPKVPTEWHFIMCHSKEHSKLVPEEESGVVALKNFTCNLFHSL